MVPAVKEDNRADPDNPTTPAAQFLLGKKYQEGAGVRQDFADAIKWYRKAAEQHEPRALHALAMMHTEGQGVEKSDENFKEGLVLLSEAANYGHHESQFLLGDMHKEGGRKVLACFWLYLARSSSDNKIATLARSEIAEISGQLDVEEIAQYLKLVGSWKPGNKGTAGMFNREDRVDEDDKAKQRPPASTENGPALSSDDGDVEKLLRSKYPNDAKLRSRVAEGLRLIMDKNRSVPLEAALETLERLSGGPLKDEADAAKVRVDIEQLFGAADRIGMSREDILKAAVESQERIHLMTKDILGADSRSHAASTANKFVVSAALALKQEQVTANKTASLGIKLGPERTLKQVLVYKENGHVHFMANYTAITMLQGGGAANNPSTKQKAQELLSDFEKTTNSIARRHLEIKARELIMEAEFGSPPSAKARRSKKQVIKFTPMPKNAIPETLTNPEPKKTPVHAPSLISHYKSIGFSEVEAEMFGSLYGEKAIEAAKALNLMASYYESRNTFDAERCMSWRYKAAKSGSPAAMFRLHQILHPNFALSFLGYPEGDAKQSLDWAIKAAEHGHADGMNAMGYYNWYGEYETDGGEVIMHPNKPQALVWWRKAAEAGSADAKAQIEKYRNGIPTTENKSAPSRQPNTNPAANSKTPAASDVVLPNAALSALQIIKNGSLDEARECVRLLDEQLKRTPGNTRIEKVKNTIVNIFREEASLTSALNNRLAAENKLTVQTRNLEIASQPSGLTGQINQDSVQRGQRLVAETQTAITSADSTANDRRAKLRELLNSALDELPAPEGPALEPVWRKVAGRNNIPISK